MEREQGRDAHPRVPDDAERSIGYPPGPSDGLSVLISVPDGFDPPGKLGLGRAMHDAVLDRVRASPEVERLRLGIVATSASVAEPFWRALGYEPTGERKPYRHDHLETAVDLWERPL